MSKLEEIKVGTKLGGIATGKTVTVLDMKWHGTDSMTVTYKDQRGQVDQELLFRSKEPELSVVEEKPEWDLNASGENLRLVSEAYRIQLAYLFDPFIAVHTSLVEPLPHQITAVYGEMLPRQPLRFLLADDPGSGKTIMAGLFLKELQIRGDLERCLIVCPGSLTEQWQDELYSKFGLNFRLITRESIEQSLTGNIFEEVNWGIARLDHLSRNEQLVGQLKHTDWDLVVCDEAHKMSASRYGQKVHRTKRNQLGQVLSSVARNFLLMTATPHNGKEADFQLFLALLDEDRFEGKYRPRVHEVDPSDLMRRMIKEDLVRFDGTPLFPERRAVTLGYKLTGPEQSLYEAVTQYVREEFNRAEALENKKRRGTVGFALTILQRRLASSPEAIYQSLKRRKERLEQRISDIKLGKIQADGSDWNDEYKRSLIEMIDDDPDFMDEIPEDEREGLEEVVIDRATAAMTIEELKAEIEILKSLELQALKVRNSGKDQKWEQLSHVLQDTPQMFDKNGHRRKLVVFTEHRDTLNYLIRRVGLLIGEEQIVTIHGGIRREDRKRAEHLFTQDSDVTILIATDAAGEGINLQCAHLMVNYDLPWNPNRLEQRFGRIHRIGQTEVCHLWNMVASTTREGAVLQRLFEKLEQENKALKGQVFNVLGRVLDNKSLRDMLIEAIRYGDSPEVRERQFKEIESKLDRDELIKLIEQKALAGDVMDASRVQAVREDMERADTKRLQPHFIQSFFMAAFESLGGHCVPREKGRFEIRHVPVQIRDKYNQRGYRDPILKKYRRITFHKDNIRSQGQDIAEFICPGHPLLNTVCDMIWDRYHTLLKQGAILVDANDPSEEFRILVYLEHAVRDDRPDAKRGRHVMSRQVHFVDMLLDGTCRRAGYAPYLDYRPIRKEEREQIEPLLKDIPSVDEWEEQAMNYAATHIAREHYEEVLNRVQNRVQKTKAAVKERLTKEIAYWDQRAQEAKEKERAGKKTRITWISAQQRVEKLDERLRTRMAELDQELRLSPAPPVVIGSALIVPGGLLARLKETRKEKADTFARETKRVELTAMAAVMQAERELGHEPSDVSDQKLGWDIESRDGQTGRLRFIEVKGRIEGAATVTISKNEILAGLNNPQQFILALAIVPLVPDSPSRDPWEGTNEAGGLYVVPKGVELHYIRAPFDREPGFGHVSVNFSIKDLLKLATPPS